MDPVVLIFAAIALFVIFKLISVLGTRTGHEQSHDIEGLQRASRPDAVAKADNQGDTDAPLAPKRKDPVSAAAQPLAEADPSFDEKAFLLGARGAYEMIVEAFAGGDLKSVRQYISAPIFDAFKSSLAARAAAEQTLDLKFVGIDKAEIVDATVGGDELQAIVEFTSDQVRTTYNKDGSVADGDPNRIDLVKDRWTFSRKRSARDPNWILVGTGSVTA